MNVCAPSAFLTNCYKISFDEFQRLISAVKLGAAVGFLSVKNFSALDELVSELRPANVGLNFEAPPTPGERDKRRAAECRAALKKIVRPLTRLRGFAYACGRELTELS